MQKKATKLFIYASLAFGVFGLLAVLTSPGHEGRGSDLNLLFVKLLQASVFVILPSFALSVAGKYLDGKF